MKDEIEQGITITETTAIVLSQEDVEADGINVFVLISDWIELVFILVPDRY